MDHQDHARNPARRPIREDGDRNASLARREALRRGLGQGVLEAEDGVAVDCPSDIGRRVDYGLELALRIALREAETGGRTRRRRACRAWCARSPFGCRDADPPRARIEPSGHPSTPRASGRPRAAAVDHQQDEGSGDHSPPPSTHLRRPGDHAAHQLIPRRGRRGPTGHYWVIPVARVATVAIPHPTPPDANGRTHRHRR